MVIQCEKGLFIEWKGLEGGLVNLRNPLLLADPGRIGITDLQAGNIYCWQEYKLWKDESNPFVSTIKLNYTQSFPFIFNTVANGTETVFVLTNANPQIDRPVTVAGQALDIHSKNSMLLLAVNKSLQIIALYDDNILMDNYNPKDPASFPKPIALALQNASVVSATERMPLRYETSFSMACSLMNSSLENNKMFRVKRFIPKEMI